MKTICMTLLCLGITLLAGFSATATSAQDPAQPEEPRTKQADQATRRAECEQMLGTMRNRARVAYAKSGSLPKTLTGEIGDGGVGASKEDLKGKYNRIHDEVYITRAGSSALVGEDTAAGDGFAIMVFTVMKGDNVINWYDTMADLKKAHLEANEGDKSNAKDPAEGDGKADDAVDAYALYKKQGRSWTHKTASKLGDMDEQVSYMKYEVTKVGEDYATLKMTFLDKDKKPMEYMEPTETKIQFVVHEPGDRADAPEMEMKEETIEAVGQKWECHLFEIENAGIVTKSWTSRKYPALLIKMQSKGESGGMAYNTTVELVEFKDGGPVDEKGDAAGEKGDAASGKGDPAANKGADQAVDAYALYKKQGRKWKHKSTTTLEGMDPIINFMEYEITQVADNHAMMKMTFIDKDGKPMAGVEPTETKIEFRAADPGRHADAPKVETKEETVKVEAGEFECIVTETHGTKVWSSKKFPGLLVKMEGASTRMELVEWKE